MNEITAPIIRFRHAAAAIGVTKKTLRNWLARGQVSLDTPTEGWANFSRLDLIRLAITAELVNFGMPIIAAFSAARSNVYGATRILEQYRNTPAAVLQHAFKGYQIWVKQPSPGKWDILHTKPGGELPEDFLDAPSLLVINSQIIADAVIDRLAEAFADDEAGDDENGEHSPE